MTRSPHFPPTRRRLLAWMTLAAVAAPAAQAQGVFGPEGGRSRDPSDDIPRWYSVRRFTALSSNDIYKVNVAIRRGRTIIIQGYSASESRQIIRDAARDWPGTRARLLRAQ